MTETYIVAGNPIGDQGGQYLLNTLSPAMNLRRLIVSPFMRRELFCQLLDRFSGAAFDNGVVKVYMLKTAT